MEFLIINNQGSSDCKFVLGNRLDDRDSIPWQRQELLSLIQRPDTYWGPLGIVSIGYREVSFRGREAPVT
jgi:hypothetical protein